MAVGSYTDPGTGTQLYVTGNTTLNGTLSVTSGGASITGSTVAQDIICTTLTASGTVSGAGFANLLSPYALATSISRYTARDPIYFSLVGTFNSPDLGKWAIGIDSTKLITCTGLTSLSVSYTHLTLPTIYSV